MEEGRKREIELSEAELFANRVFFLLVCFLLQLSTPFPSSYPSSLSKPRQHARRDLPRHLHGRSRHLRQGKSAPYGQERRSARQRGAAAGVCVRRDSEAIKRRKEAQVGLTEISPSRSLLSCPLSPPPLPLGNLLYSVAAVGDVGSWKGLRAPRGAGGEAGVLFFFDEKECFFLLSSNLSLLLLPRSCGPTNASSPSPFDGEWHHSSRSRGRGNGERGRMGCLNARRLYPLRARLCSSFFACRSLSPGRSLTLANLDHFFLFSDDILFLLPLPPPFCCSLSQRTTAMRRTVKGGKAAIKKAASKSSGAQFYGPDR